MAVELQLRVPLSGVDANDLATALPLWVDAALRHAGRSAADTPTPREVCVRIVDRAEGQSLNREYRGINKPTNVLSFPSELPAALRGELEREGLPVPLGDLVLCAPVIASEALDQGKSVRNHTAHLVVHGTLHLLGFDHLEEGPAQAMETREVAALAELDIPNPYLWTPDLEALS
ncbi:MAG: rRNA maturation RNase YbeY [Pseudomonadota bacterium]